MRVFKIICLLPLVAMPVLGQEQTPLSLREVLELAEKQNLDLAVARARRAVALAGVRIAGQRPNPNINFNTSRDDPHQSLMIVQPLEVGPKRSRRIQVAEEQGSLIDIETSSVARQVRRQVRDAYYEIALSRAESRRMAQILELTKRLLKMAQDRFEAGDVANLEVSRAELEVARAQVDATLAQQREKVAQGRLSALLNVPASTTWALAGSLEDPLPAIELEDLTQKAYQSNSDLARLAQELRVEESRQSFLRADRVPNIELGFGADFNSPAFHAGPRGQIALNIPLFSRNQGELAQSGALQRFLAAEIAASRRAVAGRVEVAFFEWMARQAEVELYRRTLRPAASRVQEMAAESYRAGKTGILVVLDAQRSVQEIEKNYLASLRSLQSAFAAVEETVGVGLN